MQKRIFTVKDITEMYGVSTPTVYKWIANGLAVVKIERVTRITAEDLADFEDKHRQISKLSA